MPDSLDPDDFPQGDPKLDASAMLRDDVHRAIRRAGRESDITAYAVIGVLEAVKLDVFDIISRPPNNDAG